MKKNHDQSPRPLDQQSDSLLIAIGSPALRRHESLISSSVTSCNDSMGRHPSKDAVSVSIQISCDIGILVTRLLSSYIYSYIIKYNIEK